MIVGVQTIRRPETFMSALMICALMIRGGPCGIVVLIVSSLVHRRLLAVGTTAVGIVGIEPEFKI